jgi:ribosome-associated protein
MRERRQTENTTEVLQTIVSTMLDKKAKEVVSLDMRKIHAAVTDFFVICHANSKTQVDAIAQHVLDEASIQHAAKPFNKEGFENAEWILIDFVDIVVHVFLDSTRQFYQLEKLWADAGFTRYEDED